MEKKIVADCDGVLLNWEYAFDCWINEKGFYKLPGTEDEYHIGNRYGITTDKGRALVKEFNQSAAIGFLPALRDVCPLYSTDAADDQRGVASCLRRAL